MMIIIIIKMIQIIIQIIMMSIIVKVKMKKLMTKMIKMKLRIKTKIRKKKVKRLFGKMEIVKESHNNKIMIKIVIIVDIKMIKDKIIQKIKKKNKII